MLAPVGGWIPGAPDGMGNWGPLGALQTQGASVERELAPANGARSAGAFSHTLYWKGSSCHLGTRLYRFLFFSESWLFHLRRATSPLL